MPDPEKGGEESGLALIRILQPHHLAPVLELTRIIPEAPSWSLEDFRALIAGPQTQRSAEATALRRVAWVAELRTQVLGLVVVQSLHFPSDPALPPECELESILTHPAARRQGLGQQLLAAAIAWCAAEGASVLRLEVRDSNGPAIRLYERNGFERTGRRPRYYAHPEEDALLMQRNFPARA